MAQVIKIIHLNSEVIWISIECFKLFQCFDTLGIVCDIETVKELIHFVYENSSLLSFFLEMISNTICNCFTQNLFKKSIWKV